MTLAITGNCHSYCLGFALTPCPDSLTIQYRKKKKVRKIWTLGKEGAPTSQTQDKN